MTSRLFEEARPMPDGTALGIVGAINQATNTRVRDGAGAHGAGFQCHEQLQPGQAVITQFGGGGAQSENFCVPGWIMTGNRAIVRLSDDLVRGRIDDNCANGRLASFCCRLRQA